MTELALPETLVDVRTGELLPATAENAAELLTAMREMRSRILDLQKECEAVLLEESRRQGTKTLHLPAATVTISGGSELEWDLEVLAELRAAGLPEERWDELVVATVTYKVSALVAKQLESANEDYAAVIARARGRVETQQRVSVK